MSVCIDLACSLLRTRGCQRPCPEAHCARARAPTRPNALAPPPHRATAATPHTHACANLHARGRATQTRRARAPPPRSVARAQATLKANLTSAAGARAGRKARSARRARITRMHRAPRAALGARARRALAPDGRDAHACACRLRMPPGHVPPGAVERTPPTPRPRTTMQTHQVKHAKNKCPRAVRLAAGGPPPPRGTSAGCAWRGAQPDRARFAASAFSLHIVDGLGVNSCRRSQDNIWGPRGPGPQRSRGLRRPHAASEWAAASPWVTATCVGCGDRLGCSDPMGPCGPMACSDPMCCNYPMWCCDSIGNCIFTSCKDSMGCGRRSHGLAAVTLLRRGAIQRSIGASPCDGRSV